MPESDFLTRIEHFNKHPLTIAAVNGATILGGVAGVASFFAQRSANRRITGRLIDIQRYLVELNRKVDTLIEQNNLIIEMLNAFRLQNRVDVRIELLDQSYSQVSALRDQFFLLGDVDTFEVGSFGWLRLMEHMGYLFDHENRLSKVYRLIEVSEFMLAAAVSDREVVALLLDRWNRHKALCADHLLKVNDELRRSLATLMTMLNDTRYVASHNVTAELPDLGELEYQAVDDRPGTETYIHRDCDHYSPALVGDGHDDPREIGPVPRMRCRNEERTRVHNDNHKWNLAKQAHITGIGTQKELVEEKARDAKNVAAVNQLVGDYIEALEESLGNDDPALSDEDAVPFLLFLQEESFGMFRAIKS